MKKAIIIGAGPAGLTAAYELITKTDIIPIIIEQTSDIGGISKTVDYKGNKIDIGGHRFFSKSKVVMNWWENILPQQGFPTIDDKILKRDKKYSTKPNAPDPEKTDLVMLIRNRLSRIFFERNFYDYPISLSKKTISNLGLMRMGKIGLSYIKASLFPIKPEKNLEDFFINRFGKELYETFFKDYTQKVWGVPCTKIKPEWGVQRIKGLSITKTLLHALKKILQSKEDIRQEKVETSLIERFWYPKFGPGQLWSRVAKIIQDKGGQIILNNKAEKLLFGKDKLTKVIIRDTKNGNTTEIYGDYFFSTMPVKDLVNSLDIAIPQNVKDIANGLVYRDFITVGLLLSDMDIKNETEIQTINNIVPDNWIYIQERDVKVGRLQIFNNWSPYLVKDLNNIWIGMEYFCNEGDEIWTKSDTEMKNFAIEEMIKMGFIKKDYVLDSVVIKMPKTYPAYFGAYDKFDIIREFTDKIENLYLIGRNGMHRYNNQDHSMLTAITAVQNIFNGIKDKSNIWEVNTEKEYHEEK